jgi:sugar-specific transcriptional regulator TrmB
MNTAILENIGFTKGEIKVFLALLGLGNTSSGPIIIKSHVSRSKVYEILERLEEKGLVSESIRENTRYFQAASPKRILDYIERKEIDLKKEKEEFKKILPSLIQKQQFAEEKQEAKVYVGFEGVKTFYGEVLKKLGKKDEYLAMTFSDKSLDNKSIIHLFRTIYQGKSVV